ncbi:MAG: class II glutamine amidotransferase [Thermoanaerobaculia bacterium]
MCRLYGFRATAPTRLDCSLVRAQNALIGQSRLDRRGFANADGWGIGLYETDRPIIKKCDTAAHEDRRFSEIAGWVNSSTVLAHVRQATVGGAKVVNTHPFAFGVWSFAHNGTLTAFDQVAPGLEQEIGSGLLSRRRGTTDSELIFLWLLSRMTSEGIKADETCGDSERLTLLLAGSIPLLAARSEEAGADEPAKLNLLLTDGVTLIASRWGNSLFWLRREGVRDCEICGLPHVEKRPVDGYRAAAVASEPITQEAWEEVPEQSVVVIDGGVEITSAPFE